MALFESWKGNILGGLAIGIGASVVAPVVIPILSTVVKPLTKAAIKGGFVLYEKSRETLAEVQEVVEDLVAESKAEIREAQETPSVPVDFEPVAQPKLKKVKKKEKEVSAPVDSEPAAQPKAG
ncbi:MAG: DUF5132 domain-containing protein [Thermodesulfobacteriota bacterium]|jgi:hypothetical protein